MFLTLIFHNYERISLRFWHRRKNPFSDCNRFFSSKEINQTFRVKPCASRGFWYKASQEDSNIWTYICFYFREKAKSRAIGRRKATDLVVGWMVDWFIRWIVWRINSILTNNRFSNRPIRETQDGRVALETRWPGFLLARNTQRKMITTVGSVRNRGGVQHEEQ